MEFKQIDPLAAPDQVRAAVAGLMAVETYTVRQDGVIVLEGRLLDDARAVYRP